MNGVEHKTIIYQVIFPIVSWFGYYIYILIDEMCNGSQVHHFH